MKDSTFDPDKTVMNMRARREHGELREGDVVLDRYELLERLGSGVMGVVFKCRDKVSHVEYAVKTVPSELARDADAMEEVRENFQLVHGLKHPNIAGVDFLDRDEYGAYFLIMEYAPGENLTQWIKRKWKAGGPEFGEVVKIIKQIASALDYAHGERILHRDVKPANVMVDDQGGVKVLDFGLASKVRNTMTALSVNPANASGTPNYLAPEQFKGKYPTPASDQYALGVIAYQMLAGHLPFESDNFTVLRAAVNSEKPDMIGGISDAANRCLQKVLAKEPNERYTTCTDFAAAMEAAENAPALPEQAAAPIPPPPSAKTNRRLWWFLAAAAVLVAVAVAVKISYDARKKAAARRQAEAERQAGELRREKERQSREFETRIREMKERLQEAEEIRKKATKERKDVELRLHEAEVRRKEAMEERKDVERRLHEAEERIAAEKRRKAEAEERRRKEAEEAALRNLGDKTTILLPGDVIKMEMVRVKAGKFIMGSPSGEDGRGEYEMQHWVTLTRDFYIGTTEVTQAQWKVVMVNNPSRFKSDDRPVENVSWNDAMDFCKKLNEMGKAPRGWKFTLPTEAQWEYAARGGNRSKGHKYSGSGNIDEVAWYLDNSQITNSKRETHPVANKKANELGLYDMSGNVWEWCLDRYEEGYARDPEFLTGNSGSFCVVRGGSWDINASLCRSAGRNWGSSGNSYTGFRVVLVQTKYKE